MASARNERRKVKKEMAVQVDTHPCGDCTVCCTTMGVPEIKKPANVACGHCRDVSKGDPPGRVGCKIYASRPPTCKTWQCLWKLGLFGPDPEAEARPDHAGILFDINTVDDGRPSMIVARELVDGAIEAAMPILQALCAQGHVLYLVQGERRRMMGPEEKVRQFKEIARRQLPVILR